MSAFGIPVNAETSDISSSLNAAVLFVFLMGMYTVIYFGTIYTYFTKKSSKFHPVPAAITVLYLSGIVETGFQWYSMKWRFVDNGATRESVFFAVFGGPAWAAIAVDVLQCVVFSIADGLLIWRCFYVWNRSFPIISLSLFLLVTEFAMFLVYTAFSIKYSGRATPLALETPLNEVLAAGFFISFGTTLVTTILISYRIYSVSKRESASSRRFKRIIDIVFQSGIVYALSQLTTAISGVVPQTEATPLETTITAFQNYTQLLNFAIAGISSTIMVARVALLSADTTYPSTSAHLSGLQFHGRSTRLTVNVEGTNVAHSIDDDIISAGESRAIAEKV